MSKINAWPMVLEFTEWAKEIFETLKIYMLWTEKKNPCYQYAHLYLPSSLSWSALECSKLKQMRSFGTGVMTPAKNEVALHCVITWKLLFTREEINFWWGESTWVEFFQVGGISKFSASREGGASLQVGKTLMVVHYKVRSE